ncbi:flocculation protein FLO11 [Biomphalaria pfeifferi]|uniref:Flocculation protein FLO11 n=1 Tax=Biomphalaria pfeifferi TaxID=112525 RepID=A0AAD8FJD0_BIOPF|nr:flocculation protein FLO11 [Biomphalaria pfeifferi]
MPRVLIAVSGHGSVRRSLCVYVNPVATFLAHSKGLGRRRTPPVVLTSSLVIFNQNTLKFEEELVNQFEEELVNQFEEELVNQFEEELVNQFGEESVNQCEEELVNQFEEESVNQFQEELVNQFGEELVNQFEEELVNQFGEELVNQFEEELVNQFGEESVNQCEEELVNQFEEESVNQFQEELVNQFGEELVNQFEEELVNQFGEELVNQFGEELINIQFNDSKIETFEYPSEEWALEKYLEEHPNESADVIFLEDMNGESAESSDDGPETPRGFGNDDGLKSNTSLSSSGNLQSYKGRFQEDFQFGSAIKEKEPEPVIKPEEPPVDPDALMLRPAEEVDTSTWSTNNSSDLLF